MSEPASAHASLSATGYADGLGRRTLEFDRESGGMLERLHLRVLTPRQLPANDGGISYGQAAVAARRLG